MIPIGDASERSRRWPAIPLAAILLGVAILAAPSAIEGPVLLPISPGHALSVLDTAGVVPLVAGSCWLYLGLWQRRRKLYARAAVSPGRAVLIVFTSGFGLGLLVASAFSAFFWWWAVGAAVFGATLLALTIAAAGD